MGHRWHKKGHKAKTPPMLQWSLTLQLHRLQPLNGDCKMLENVVFVHADVSVFIQMAMMGQKCTGDFKQLKADSNECCNIISNIQTAKITVKITRLVYTLY